MGVKAGDLPAAVRTAAVAVAAAAIKTKLETGWKRLHLGELNIEEKPSGQEFAGVGPAGELLHLPRRPGQTFSSRQRFSSILSPEGIRKSQDCRAG